MTTASRAAPVRGPAHRSRARGGAAAPAPRLEARDIVLAVLGVLGILTVSWLIASAVFSLGLVVFVTGSMGPTMPAGAAALTRVVPAAELRIGDVVTVRRPSDGTPVTHRIVGIEAAAGDADARSLALRGDANRVVDSDRYVLDEAPRVVASVPGGGELIVALKSPAAGITLTVVVAAAIAWALWPGRAASPRNPPSQEPECAPSPPDPR